MTAYSTLTAISLFRTKASAAVTGLRKEWKSEIPALAGKLSPWVNPLEVRSLMKVSLYLLLPGACLSALGCFVFLFFLSLLLLSLLLLLPADLLPPADVSADELLQEHFWPVGSSLPQYMQILAM